MDSSVNADDKEQFQVEKTDDSCTVDFIEIVPVTRDTDSSCTTECVSGDWSAEVKQENLTVVKQEPDDVCYFLCPMYSIYHHRINLYRLLVTVQISFAISVISHLMEANSLLLMFLHSTFFIYLV